MDVNNVPGNLKLTGKIGGWVGITVATGYAGDLIAGSRAAAVVRQAVIDQLPEAKNLPKILVGLMHLASGEVDHVAEELGLKEAQTVLTEEKAGMVQVASESGATEEVGQLEGQAAQKAGQNTLKSMAAATAVAKGYDSVKANANGTITGKYTPIGSRISRTVTCNATSGCTSN